jgi:murein DD-endopeptidase MepM/ murein hydrolase activator NlpD
MKLILYALVIAALTSFEDKETYIPYKYTEIETIYKDTIIRDTVLLNTIPFIYPLKETDITGSLSPFGMRLHPILKRRKMHSGIDIGADKGTPIYSSGYGKVIRIEKKRTGYGNNIIIEHNKEYQSLYAHLKDIKIKIDDSVTPETVIGTVGKSGQADGYHLHYEIIKNNKKVNPINYLYEKR